MSAFSFVHIKKKYARCQSETRPDAEHCTGTQGVKTRAVEPVFKFQAPGI